MPGKSTTSTTRNKKTAAAAKSAAKKCPVTSTHTRVGTSRSDAISIDDEDGIRGPETISEERRRNRIEICKNGEGELVSVCLLCSRLYLLP